MVMVYGIRTKEDSEVRDGARDTKILRLRGVELEYRQASGTPVAGGRELS